MSSPLPRQQHKPDISALEPASAVSSVDPSKHVPDTCVVCLSEISERAVAYPCNHLVFDFLCLVSWLEQRPTCPLCNVAVQYVEYDWRSPSECKRYTVPKEARDLQVNYRGRGRGRGYDRFFRGSARQTWQRAPSVDSPDTALERRKLVYARNSFSLHRAPSSSRSALTSVAFRESPPLQRKARLFLRRELQVFTFLQTTSRLEFVLEYIVGMLRKLEIKGADGAMENLLAEILGRDASRLLLHELGAWLVSSLDRLDDWDRAVQYNDHAIMTYRGPLQEGHASGVAAKAR